MSTEIYLWKYKLSINNNLLILFLISEVCNLEYAHRCMPIIFLKLFTELADLLYKEIKKKNQFCVHSVVIIYNFSFLIMSDKEYNKSFLYNIYVFINDG